LCVLYRSLLFLSNTHTHTHTHKQTKQSSGTIPAGGTTASNSTPPPLPGKDDCPPTKPEELSDCGPDNLRCSYYNSNVDPQGGGITNCDCAKNQGFRCRPAKDVPFSF
jgi:hypothetical protein